MKPTAHSSFNWITNAAYCLRERGDLGGKKKPLNTDMDWQASNTYYIIVTNLIYLQLEQI